MKGIILSCLFVLPFFVQSQNMVYLERTSTIDAFNNGLGSVEVHQIGVHPSLDLYVRYDEYVAGSGVSTGWLPYTSGPINNIYDNAIEVIGVYPTSGDTLIRVNEHFADLNYEITSIIAQGFDAYGQIDDFLNDPWEIEITFSVLIICAMLMCKAFYFRLML